MDRTSIPDSCPEVVLKGLMRILWLQCKRSGEDSLIVTSRFEADLLVMLNLILLPGFFLRLFFLTHAADLADN